MSNTFLIWAMMSPLLQLSQPISDAKTVETVEQAVSKLQSTLERVDRSSFLAERRLFRKKANESREELLHVRKWQVLRDRSRWNLLGYEESISDNPLERHVNEYNLICNQQFMQVYSPRKDANVRSRVPLAVHGHLSPTDADRAKWLSHLDEVSFVFGNLRIESFVSFSDLFKSGTKPRATEPCGRDDDGLFVAVLTKDGGDLRLWMNPNASFLPSRLRMKRSGSNLAENRSRELRQYVESDLGIAANVPVKSVTYEIKNVMFEPWKDTHVITSFEVTNVFESDDGAKAIDRQEVRFSEWNLDPDVTSPAAFLPLLPVPEGFRVEAQDQPSIMYTYRNGRIEKDVNESTVAGLGAVKLPERRTVARVQWGWFAIAGVLAFILWRIRSKEVR